MIFERNRLIKKFSRENKPIEIKYDNELLSTLYYGNSTVINKLKYYPLALLLIVVLFGSVVYFFYRSSRTAALNKLWSGMAKGKFINQMKQGKWFTYSRSGTLLNIFNFDKGA